MFKCLAMGRADLTNKSWLGSLIQAVSTIDQAQVSILVHCHVSIRVHLLLAASTAQTLFVPSTRVGARLRI